MASAALQRKIKAIKLFGVPMPVKWEAMDGFFGQYHTTPSPHIKLHPEMNDDVAASVLLHEIVHAIANETKTKMVERDVRCMSSGLFDVIRNNPDFARALLKA